MSFAHRIAFGVSALLVLALAAPDATAERVTLKPFAKSRKGAKGCEILIEIPSGKLAKQGASVSASGFSGKCDRIGGNGKRCYALFQGECKALKATSFTVEVDAAASKPGTTSSGGATTNKCLSGMNIVTVQPTGSSCNVIMNRGKTHGCTAGMSYSFPTQNGSLTGTIKELFYSRHKAFFRENCDWLKNRGGQGQRGRDQVEGPRDTGATKGAALCRETVAAMKRRGTRLYPDIVAANTSCRGRYQQLSVRDRATGKDYDCDWYLCP